VHFLRPTLLILSLVAVLGGSAIAPAATLAAEENLGSELMRLTNLDRQALGKPALAVDPTLAEFAANRSFTCPSDGGMTVSGRAADMAARDYFTHTVKGCRKSDGSEYGSLDIMSLRIGYNTNRGENIAYTGYPTNTTSTYDTGCAIGVSSGCPGGSTTTISAVARAQRMFMDSSGHRANILGAYDRFGCGSGMSTDGVAYFACLFSKGGPTSLPFPSGDTIRPRVTHQTGKGATYIRGYARRFYATLSDNVRVLSARVYLDGHRLTTWAWSGSLASARRSILVPSWRLTRGTHTIIWRAYDASGNGSTTLDGKVVFTIR
jgi:uncharacterized protein YkwD